MQGTVGLGEQMFVHCTVVLKFHLPGVKSAALLCRPSISIVNTRVLLERTNAGAGPRSPARAQDTRLHASRQGMAGLQMA